MAKENHHEHAETGKPLPHCKALLLCEKVTESQITGKVTLHNLIEAFQSRIFPGRSTPFTIFLQVYDGIGRYVVSTEITDLADGSIVARTALRDLYFPDRLTRIQLVVPVESVRLPRSGRYEMVVFVEGQPLASQHFEAEVDNGGE